MQNTTNKSDNTINKKNTLLLPAILLTVVVVTAIAGVLIAQRQYRIRESVSPADPESRPSAAEETNCTLSFTPEDDTPPGDGTATCIDKQAHTTFLAQNSNFNQTNMPYRSNVTRGQQFVYRIIIGPEDTESASQVSVIDPLPPHVSFVDNPNNTPGISYDDRVHAVSITLDQVTSEQTIEFMVEVTDDAPTTSPLSWFWNTAYVGDVDDDAAGGLGNRDAECSTKLVVVSGSNTDTGRTTPQPTPTPAPPRR